MEKIWLKVEEVRLHSLHPTKSTDEEEKTIWASLRLDSALNINGIQINSKTNRKKDSWFSQNWALATARLLDVPALHKEDIRTPLLHDVLARAIYLFCHQKDGDKIRAFIENGGEEPQLPPFKPEDWKGLSLYVPVAFIKLRHFQCQTTQGPVRVEVQIVHQLIL